MEIVVDLMIVKVFMFILDVFGLSLSDSEGKLLIYVIVCIWSI